MSPAELAPESAQLFNRELSWLEFERRILTEARRADVPLMERLKFLAIFSGNLDEFFMVRIAGLQRQIAARVQKPGPDGLTPQETYDRCIALCRELQAEQYRIYRDELTPLLEAEGIRLVSMAEVQARGDGERLHSHFIQMVYPLLTPVAVDPSHPFPNINNKTLNLAVLLQEEGGTGARERFAIVQVPTVMSRFVSLSPEKKGPGRTHEYVLLEDLIGHAIGELFPGFVIREWTTFRLSRDSDMTIDQEEEIQDLLEVIRKELLRKRRGEAVRLEIAAGVSDKLLHLIQKPLDIDAGETHRIDGPLGLGDMMDLVHLVDKPALHDPSFKPVLRKGLDLDDNIFQRIRQGDILLHHPYDSFESVINVIRKAADDPKVLAIKTTLYRAGNDPRIINALIRAAENGKQVTVLVELRARFDEQNNISRAHELERAGVHVVYGLVRLKIHCKALLIIRKEAAGIVRYVHLSTGNYNPVTAGIYTDLGYLTCRADFGEDATTLFNYLTGYAKPQRWNRLLVAPADLKKALLQMIRDEVAAHREDGQGRILLKMNALVDADCIQELYLASQAGVAVELVIRGICCLRPGVPGLSDNIRVHAHIDKYLEHSRIFYFHHGRIAQVWVGSPDWMPRNFYSRVEVVFPVLDPKLREQCLEILTVGMNDNTHAFALRADGGYDPVRPRPGEAEFRQQLVFERLAEKSMSRAELRQLLKQPLPGAAPAPKPGENQLPITFEMTHADAEISPLGKSPVEIVPADGKV